MVDKSSRLPGDDFNPLLSLPFTTITSAIPKMSPKQPQLIPDRHPSQPKNSRKRSLPVDGVTLNRAQIAGVATGNRKDSERQENQNQEGEHDQHS